MRIILAALFAALLLLPASADTGDWSREQRRDAARFRASGKLAEAEEALRLAVVADRRDGFHEEAALALTALAAQRRDSEFDAAASGKDVKPVADALYGEALREAVAAGDRALEARIRDERSRTAETEEGRKAAIDGALDAATVARDFDIIEDQRFMEVDVDPAYGVMDLQAEADLALKRGDGPAAAALLAAAVAAAEKRGLPLTAAVLRVRGAEADPAKGGALAAAALGAFEKRGDFRGIAEARLAAGRCKAAAGDAAGAGKEFQAALTAAREIRDLGFEAAALTALAGVADPSRKAALSAAAEQAEKRRHADVMRRAEEAAAEPDIDTEAAAVAELRDERLRRPADRAEVDRLLSLLGESTGARPAMKASLRDKLKALVSGDDAGKVVPCLEALRRTEAFPVLADALAGSTQPWVLSLGIETLSTADDKARLFEFLSETKGAADVAAAAALFRLCDASDVPAIRKALAGKLSAPAVVWLNAALAREGDAAALAALRKDSTGSEPTVVLNAFAALGRLGFGTPYKAVATLPDGFCGGAALHIVLARAPQTWGTRIRWNGATEVIDRIYAARSAFLRGDRRRAEGIDDENNAFCLVFELPRTPAERAICGTAWLSRAHGYMQEGGDELLWMTEGDGFSVGNGRDALKKRKDNPIATFAAEDLEEHRYGATAGAQTRTITLDGGGAWATCRATAIPETGAVVNDTLELPFRLRWTTDEGDDGSLAGKIGHVALDISLSSLVHEAHVDIPGFPSIEAKVGTSSDDRITVSAPLPHLKEGEGLGNDKLVPMETIEKGTVTLVLIVDKNRQEMTFPLSFLVPPKKDKPDLVATEVIIEPAVPKPGEEARVTLRARNIGKEVPEGAIVSVRFTVLNPQTGEGKRTISVVLDSAGGWRPGEWRTFDAKPKAVQDWYMNKYMSSWTVEMGDTRISATIDADNAVAEDLEDNNTCEVDVPLYVPDEEGQRAATEEILAKLEKLIKEAGEAKTTADAYMNIGAMKTILARSKVSNAEIDLSRRHLEAAVQIQVERIRMDEIMKEADALSKEPNPNPASIRRLMGQVAAAQADLLDSGVPIKGDTLTDIRNRTQAAANLSGAAADYGTLSGIVKGEGGGADGLRSISENLNRLDGALQLLRYARDRVKNKQADNGDAIEGMCALATGATPGVTKLHMAMLQSEMDYVDKGLRKEADVLDNLAALIGGDKSAQQRLDASCKDVGDHLKAGPFNKNTLKGLVVGAVKDVPILGKIVDAIVSWK